MENLYPVSYFTFAILTFVHVSLFFTAITDLPVIIIRSMDPSLVCTGQELRDTFDLDLG